MRKLIPFLLLWAAPAWARSVPVVPEQTFETWIGTQPPVLIESILAHVSPADALPGNIIASPERKAPDYYFHWVRDAALTMITLHDAGEVGLIPSERRERIFDDFVALSRRHQENAPFPAVAKFYVDTARPYLEPWCQPQWDGPALRAIAIMGHARARLAAGNQREAVRSELTPVIFRDLDVTAAHWWEAGCDLWEETVGHHFYTRMVQRRALIEGQRLAAAFNDADRAARYGDAARRVTEALEGHFNPRTGLIRATLDAAGVIKDDDLDSAVVLGLLHGRTDEPFVAFTDPRVSATIERLEHVFRELYPINRAGPGLGIGRYKEDTWNQERGRHGNPWYLLTAAFAQTHFRASLEASDLAEAERLFAKGEDYLRRVHYHAREGGYRRFDEQFDRFSGQMTSAPDLTWSYAEVLEAGWARDEAARALALWRQTAAGCAHGLDPRG